MNLMNLQNLKILTQKRKALTLENAARLLRGRQKNLNILKAEYFQHKRRGKEKKSGLLACVAKVCDRLQLRILSPKQMLQRLPIALARVKADNTSENLLYEICQIIYSSYRVI